MHYFIIGFSLKHGNKVVELLKYMKIMRGLLRTIEYINGLKITHTFRLRMSKNPSKNWATIDGHLGLSCGLFGDLSVVTQSAAPCCIYNLRRICAMRNCAYVHACMKGERIN